MNGMLRRDEIISGALGSTCNLFIDPTIDIFMKFIYSNKTCSLDVKHWQRICAINICHIGDIPLSDQGHKCL